MKHSSLFFLIVALAVPQTIIAAGDSPTPSPSAVVVTEPTDIHTTTGTPRTTDDAARKIKNSVMPIRATNYPSAEKQEEASAARTPEITKIKAIWRYRYLLGTLLICCAHNDMLETPIDGFDKEIQAFILKHLALIQSLCVTLPETPDYTLRGTALRTFLLMAPLALFLRFNVIIHRPSTLPEASPYTVDSTNTSPFSCGWLASPVAPCKIAFLADWYAVSNRKEIAEELHAFSTSGTIESWKLFTHALTSSTPVKEAALIALHLPALLALGNEMASTMSIGSGGGGVGDGDTGEAEEAAA